MNAATARYQPTHEELASLFASSDYESNAGTLSETRVSGDTMTLPDSRSIITSLVRIIYEEGPQALVDYAMANNRKIHEAAAFDPEVAEALVTVYKIGIARGDAYCANNLGALYYLGDMIEQDYPKAAELYELAIDLGCYQSLINLGYIYEYGRLGEADHQKAYELYSLAAALEPTSEALYKLGDMFSRGRAVERDIKKAYLLWERSLSLAYGEVEEAQPGIRIAALLVDPQNESLGIPYDPRRALELYLHAEIGLRDDIDDGQFYYQKRLAEAIEGQALARAALDNGIDFQ